jgi:trimeric autotransporter adhesin
MRRTFLVTLLAASLANAQTVPTTMTYTGKLTNSGAPVTGTHNIVFGLYAAATGGAPLWEETFIGLMVDQGFFTTVLGQTVPLDQSVITGADRWLQVSVDGTPLLPRVLLTSVAYAIRAGDSDTLGGLTSADFAPSDSYITGIAVGTGLTGGGTTGDVSVNIDWVNLGSCVPGSSIRGWDSTGTVQCEADDTGGGAGTGDISSVNTAPGSGLLGGGIQGDLDLSVDFAVFGSCSIGNAVTGINAATGAVACAPLGDITGVLPGAGLLNGGTSGDVTLDVNFAVFGACTPPQKVTGINAITGAVVCADDANSGGTVTSVDTGSGLTGGIINTSGTISVAIGGINSTHLDDNTVFATVRDATPTDQFAVTDGNNGLRFEAATGLVATFGAVNHRVIYAIAPGGVSTTELGADAVTSAKIAPDTIAAVDIGVDAVGSSEIAANAVGTSEIADGTVALADLAANSIDSSKIVNASVGVADLASGALAAAGSVALSGSTTSTTPATLDQFTVTYPGPGTLVVQVDGGYYIDADAAASTSITQCGNLGLCDSANSSAACGGTYNTFCTQDAEDSAPSASNETYFFSLTRVVTVAAAGSSSFYVNGETPSAAQTLFLYSSGTTFSPRATIIFLPAAAQLSVTSP